MHAYAKMPHYMLKFGSAGNFSGQIGERALKGIVKDHAARTQKRPGSFAEQCAIREYERNVLKYVMTDLDIQLGVRSSGKKANTAKKEFRGRFILSLSKTNNRGVGTSDDNVTWHDKKKNKMNVFIADLFVFAIRRFGQAHGYNDEFKVTGYTTYINGTDASEDSIKYYATEYMNGGKRYDYAMIDFVLDDGDTATCPAKILGFVRYNITNGVPTPQGAGTDDDHIDGCDQNIYVVVHTASDYVSLEQLQNDFVSYFTLGNVETCLFIVDIDAIRGPLFVFKNYGADGHEKNKLFCALPQSNWGKYFSDRIY
jgi:hypothetical protein